MIMMDQDRLNHSIAVARKMVEIGKNIIYQNLEINGNKNLTS